MATGLTFGHIGAAALTAMISLSCHNFAWSETRQPNSHWQPVQWTAEERLAQHQQQTKHIANVELTREYALGVGRYKLDHATKLTGWEISDGVYFGRAKGDSSGIALVWQRRNNQQVSLSNEGVRYTRRF